MSHDPLGLLRRSEAANNEVERLYAELASGVPALVAAQDDRPVSIITKTDLLEFVAHQRKRR